MSLLSLRAKLKPAVLATTPWIYYWRIIKQSRKEMNVNSQVIQPVIAVAYDPFGKYPTMYDKPQSFYKNQKQARQTDPYGIPIVIENEEKIYHPVKLIQYGLSEFTFYKSTGESLHFFEARAIADWLVSNQDPTNGYWYYTKDFYHNNTDYLIKAPWASAMAQGQAISLLVRVFHETSNEKYLQSAKIATTMLDVPISEGGLAADLWGHMIYEEYPTTPPSFTLNGFMFSALGLYDLTQVVHDNRFVMLWDTAKYSLQFMLPLFDGEIMSAYCLSHVTMPTAKRQWADAYHALHIVLLQTFEAISPCVCYECYIVKWASYFGIKIVGDKNEHKIQCD